MTKLLAGLIVFTGAAVLICLLSFLLAWPTMWLWNGVMPDVFGLKLITWTQALYINLLSGILFKSSCSSSSN